MTRKRTPQAVIELLEIADRKLNPREYQRFLHACAQVVEVREVGKAKRGKATGNVVYLIPPKNKL